MLESARRSDAVVYGVTAGNSGKVGFVSSLSQQTGGQSMEVSSTMDLQKTFVGILDEFPAPLRPELHAARRFGRRLASASGPRQGTPRGGYRAPGVYRRRITYRGYVSDEPPHQ